MSGRLNRAFWRRLEKGGRGARAAHVRATLSETVPCQVRAMRESRGWKLDELARRAGKRSATSASRWEDPCYGGMSLNTLHEIAQAFDVGLLIKFVPFSRFLQEYSDMTTAAMSADGFDADIPPGDIFATESQSLVAGARGETVRPYRRQGQGGPADGSWRSADASAGGY